MRTRPENIPLGFAFGLIGVVIFGGTLPMTRVALGAFSPAFIACGRAALAALVAALALALFRMALPRTAARDLFAAGLLLVFGFPGFSTLAMQTIPAAHGGVVLGILPLLTAAFAALVAGERPGPAFWGWSVAGAALVLVFTLSGQDIEPGIGDFWLLCAARAAALGYVLSARAARILPGWAVISWALVLTFPLSATGALIAAQGGIASPGPAEWGAFLYLAFGSMFGGFIFWNAGLAMGGIARVGQTQLLQTFVTLGLAALVAGESISTATVVFAVLVAATVWMGRNARVVRAPLPRG
jgi:drug/metabolite transporter (DMT)-like permease